MKTSLTGSYPPSYEINRPLRNRLPAEQEELVFLSITQAVNDQNDAGIDYPVDGQVRDDFVSIFANHLPGFISGSIPYAVNSRVEPSEQPITVGDFQYARSLAPDKPFKAHITGPIVISQSIKLIEGAPYASRHDRQLILDLARALGHEARLLVEAGAEVIQIDEPNLSDGVDLELAFEAMQIIFDSAKPPFPALHACSNILPIITTLLERAPVRMISLEGTILNDPSLSHINRKYLQDCGKQIGLGCIDVRGNPKEVETIQVLQISLDQFAHRLGLENIWAAMPNCGMRRLERNVAKQKLEILAKAAHAI